jgi:hypothetical protein
MSTYQEVGFWFTRKVVLVIKMKVVGNQYAVNIKNLEN